MKLLFEIGTEELPAGEIVPALAAIKRHIEAGAAADRLAIGAVHTYATPRRLAVVVEDVAPAAETVEETHMGPAAKIAFDADGNPTRAAQGFARGKGIDPSALLRVETAKGEYVAAKVVNEGRAAADVFADVLSGAFAAIPWKKSMRWGWGDATFSRPVHWIVALLDDAVLPVTFTDVTSGRCSRGHRFHANHDVEIAHAGDYVEALHKAKVVVDIDARKQTILSGLQGALEPGHVLVESEGLLDEVAQLVEWPVPLVGAFDEALLEVPREVLITSMATHQRYFAVERADGSLANRFAFVSNIEVERPQVIIDGNRRVLLARLEDAKFFFREDKKTRLDARGSKLEAVRYIEGLGSMQDRVARIMALSEHLSGLLYAGDDAVAGTSARASALCKADLATGMVYEFPELQGIMGRYYALADGEDADVAEAIAEHYRPQGPSDAVPATRAGAVVALADKLDAIAGCFALGLIPSGSADPYGLRRAALGVLRVLIEHGHAADLEALLGVAYDALPAGKLEPRAETIGKAFSFMQGRLRAMLAADAPTDIVDAVLPSLGSALPSASVRVDALTRMRAEADFEALAAGYKRAVNILRKVGDDALLDGSAPAPDVALYCEDAEGALGGALTEAEPKVAAAIDADDYDAAAAALLSLKAPIDRFFDDVMVNTDDEAVRTNRQRLLARVRACFSRFADIGRIQIG